MFRSLCFVFGICMMGACVSIGLAKDLECTWKYVKVKVTWEGEGQLSGHLVSEDQLPSLRE